MILIPSLQLMGGKVVRLDDGSPDSKTVLAENPVQIARTFAQQGALFFQLVDLDAVFGLGDNLDVVKAFADAMLPCQVGGGIRDAGRAETLLEAGADRVMIGTLFHSDPSTAKAIVDRFGVRIMAAIDADDQGYVRTHGWQEQGSPVEEAWGEITAAGATTVVYTCTVAGIADQERERIANIARRGDEDGVDIYIDAGATTVEQLQSASSIESVDGVLIGHQLYASSLDIKPALATV